MLQYNVQTFNDSLQLATFNLLQQVVKFQFPDRWLSFLDGQTQGFGFLEFCWHM